MAQEYKSVGIVGAGASGCACAYFLLQAGIDVTIFDISSPLRTLLPTGGGRCNLAHSEFDPRELAKNYTRGEKFLYSLFSRFATQETLDFFEKIGVKTYIQENGRIFPISNSAKDVRDKMLNSIKSANFVKEKVISINNNNLKTEKAEYFFNDIIIATGGRKFELKGLEKHNFIPFVPSLVGLNTEQKFPSGIIVQNAFNKELNKSGDILFTHFGISGPLIYEISSVKARDSFPYKLHFDFCNQEFNLQDLMNENPHKDLKNLISAKLKLPINFVTSLIGEYSDIKCHKINKEIRNTVLNKINNFEFLVTSANKGEETVSAGGFDLKEINPKTMESKIYPHIYFTGEVLDIDGLCGGFNLQNCWSTAYVAAKSIIES